MRAGRIILVGAALGAVSLVTMGAVSIVSHVHPGSAEGAVTRVNADPDRQSAPDPTAPITPAEAAADRAYGWGPFRVVDW